MFEKYWSQAVTQLRWLGGVCVEITVAFEYVGSSWSFQILVGMVLVIYHVLFLRQIPTLKVYLTVHPKKIGMVT